MRSVLRYSDCGFENEPARWGYLAARQAKPNYRAVFSGDTVFEGGPGATGRSYSGHGDSTIGDEIVHYDEWVARGH
jgi:hypothetical protein